MHHIRILITGPDGRVAISKTELENLLAIAYQDGYEKGKKECEATHSTAYDDGFKAGYAKGLSDSTCHCGDNTIYCHEPSKVYLNGTGAVKTNNSSVICAEGAKINDAATEAKAASKEHAVHSKNIYVKQHVDDAFEVLNTLLKEVSLL